MFNFLSDLIGGIVAAAATGILALGFYGGLPEEVVFEPIEREAPIEHVIGDFVAEEAEEDIFEPETEPGGEVVTSVPANEPPPSPRPTVDYDAISTQLEQVQAEALRQLELADELKEQERLEAERRAAQDEFERRLEESQRIEEQEEREREEMRQRMIAYYTDEYELAVLEIRIEINELEREWERELEEARTTSGLTSSQRDTRRANINNRYRTLIRNLQLEIDRLELEYLSKMRELR
jgi:hypothetical protein